MKSKLENIKEYRSRHNKSLIDIYEMVLKTHDLYIHTSDIDHLEKIQFRDIAHIDRKTWIFPKGAIDSNKAWHLDNLFIVFKGYQLINEIDELVFENTNEASSSPPSSLTQISKDEWSLRFGERGDTLIGTFAAEFLKTVKNHMLINDTSQFKLKNIKKDIKHGTSDFKLSDIEQAFRSEIKVQGKDPYQNIYYKKSHGTYELHKWIKHLVIKEKSV